MDRTNFLATIANICSEFEIPLQKMGHRGRDRMLVGFTTTCATSVYH